MSLICAENLVFQINLFHGFQWAFLRWTKNVGKQWPNHVTGFFTIEMSNINSLSVSGCLFKFVSHNLHRLNSGSRLLSELCADDNVVAIAAQEQSATRDNLYLLTSICDDFVSIGVCHVCQAVIPAPYRVSTSKIHFAGCDFHLSAPAVWNFLPRTVLNSPSLRVFKSRLKIYLFHTAYNDTKYQQTAAATASEVTCHDPTVGYRFIISSIIIFKPSTAVPEGRLKIVKS